MTAAAAKPAIIADEELDVSALVFDSHNPRVPNEAFESEEAAVRTLLDEYDVEELIQSILSSGWIDYEPLIVDASSNVVYEGNRRLAALRLITSAELRKKLDYKLPVIPNAHTAPARVRVRKVTGRADARRFIAFKHINGPFKWDAFAKAKYAAEWLDEGEDVDVVSRMLGDNNNTIRRLVAGFRVLEQAEENGFDRNDRSKKRFSFSHLYTAISRPAVREFLGMEDDGDAIPKNPVPNDKIENLNQLMAWLYGQEKKGQPTVVVSQNPNLNQLVRVIENPRALASLVASKRLDVAYEEVEPAADRFKDALISATKQCETSLGLSTHYDGDPTLLAMCQNLAATVRNLRDTMVRMSTGVGGDL